MDAKISNDFFNVLIEHLEDGCMMNLQEAKYRTIHCRKGAVDAIATQTGIEKGTLYRYALPDDQSGLDIPMSKLIPIMNASKVYDLLRIMAVSCGFLAVRIPRTARSKRDESEIVHFYQKVCNEAVSKLLDFFENPSEQLLRAAVDALQDVAAESIAVQKNVEHHHQTDLELDA